MPRAVLASSSIRLVVDRHLDSPATDTMVCRLEWLVSPRLHAPKFELVCSHWTTTRSIWIFTHTPARGSPPCPAL